MSENLSQLVGDEENSQTISQKQKVSLGKMFWLYKGNVLRTFHWNVQILAIYAPKGNYFLIFFGTSTKTITPYFWDSPKKLLFLNMRMEGWGLLLQLNNIQCGREGLKWSNFPQFHKGAAGRNKLASLEAMLVWNSAHWLTRW